MGALKYFTVFLLVSQTVSAETEVSRSFIENKILPDVVSCAPERLVQVRYGNQSVNLGNELSLVTTTLEPSVEWDANPASFYTLAMVDPDALSRANPTLREIKHWLVGNIPGNNISQGESLAPYLSPTPPPGTGLHRYTFLVYLQTNGTVKFEEIPIVQTADRFKFSVDKFARKYNFSLCFGNFFQEQTIPVAVI